jgi:DNA replication protein DnaC
MEVRNRLAIESKLSYVEFLAQLLEDEVERRAQHKLKMRLRRAAFDPQKTLETFDFSACPKLSQKEIADLATCRFVERHQNAFFVGPAGVGKSHLAQALGHEACRRGYDVLFLPAARALAQLAAGRADGTYERRLAGFARPHLVILDDFGLKPLRPPGPEDLYEIVAERYEKGSMIITSNRAFAEWPELFGEPLLASAALDRLGHDAHQVVITGESYRTRATRRRATEKNGVNEARAEG